MESAEQRWLSSNNHNNEREKKNTQISVLSTMTQKKGEREIFFFATISPGSSWFKKNALVIASCGAFFACAIFISIVCKMCEIRFSLRKHFDWPCKMIERIECCERPCPISSMMCDHQIKCLISPAFAIRMLSFRCQIHKRTQHSRRISFTSWTCNIYWLANWITGVRYDWTS